MADALRSVAIESVAQVEGAPTPPKLTEHGAKVAGVLRAEAAKDVFTSLQIAAGEQVSPAILRANLDISIGKLMANGTIDATEKKYADRLDRGKKAIKRVEAYFDDKRDFEAFATTPEGKAVVDTTGKFLMTHPALTEYFGAITDPALRLDAAKQLASQYLKDPFTYDKIKTALLDSAINKGEVADEYSEVARKEESLRAKAAQLEAKKKKLEGDPAATPPVKGEIEALKSRRREFDRYSDSSTTPPTEGSEFKMIQDKRKDMATIDGEISKIDGTIKSLEGDKLVFEAELRDARKKGYAGTRSEADIAKDIQGKNKDINDELNKKKKQIVDKAVKQAEIDAIEADRKQIEAELQKKIEELNQVVESLSGIKSEHGEQVIKLKKLEAAKGRAEELAVSELENVFKKGVEQELIDRLERARSAADKALEESAARTKDINEKQYREKLAKRHKTPDGKVDGKSINEDFTGMMRPSQEYHVVKNPADPNKVYMYEKNDAGAWIPLNGGPVVGAVAGSDIYYLTGPEFSMLQMMNNTSEFDGDYLLGKLKDTEWMQTEAMNFAAKTLQDKMYASRGWLQRRRTGVKRLSSAEITKIQNSTWGVGLLEQALEQNKAHIDSLEKAMKGGALGGEVLTGPGTWKDKIARMSKAQVALLILALTASGILLGPLALPTATGAGTLIGGLGLSQSVGGAIAGGAAGIAAARARRRA